MKQKFIINPHAGNFSFKKRFIQMQAHFQKEMGSFDYELTQNRMDAIHKTRKALKEGYDHIVAVGGDGTINAVANGFFENEILINNEALLGLSRSGTGSDYYRAVANHRNWFDLVSEYTARPTDLGRIEFLKSGLSPVYFLNLASVGLSAFVVERQSRMPSFLPALLSYSIPAVSTLISFRAVPLKIRLDETYYEDDYLNLFTAKGRTAGGGMKLGGNVLLDDGKFDVTLVRGMPLYKSLFKFPKLFSGQFQNDRQFIKTKAKLIEVISPTPLPVEFDGEVFGTTDIRISVLPKAIRVAFP